MKLTRLLALLLLIQTQPQTGRLPQRCKKAIVPPPSQLAHSLDPPNPFMARGWAAAEHDDSYSSDVSPMAGPGSGPVNIHVRSSGSLCPTLVLDWRGSVFAYCVETATRRAWPTPLWAVKDLTTVLSTSFLRSSSAKCASRATSAIRCILVGFIAGLQNSRLLKRGTTLYQSYRF